MSSALKLSGALKLANLPTSPANPTAGEVYLNTTSNTLELYKNGSWTDIGDLAAAVPSRSVNNNNYTVGTLESLRDMSTDRLVLKYTPSDTGVLNSFTIFVTCVEGQEASEGMLYWQVLGDDNGAPDPGNIIASYSEYQASGNYPSSDNDAGVSTPLPGFVSANIVAGQPVYLVAYTDSSLRFNIAYDDNVDGVGYISTDSGVTYSAESNFRLTVELQVAAITSVDKFLKTNAVGYLDSTFLGGASINALADVDTLTTPPNTNDYLKFNGTNWVPQALASGLQAAYDVDSTVSILDNVPISLTANNGPALHIQCQAGNALTIGGNSSISSPNSNTDSAGIALRSGDGVDSTGNIIVCTGNNSTASGSVIILTGSPGFGGTGSSGQIELSTGAGPGGSALAFSSGPLLLRTGSGETDDYTTGPIQMVTGSVSGASHTGVSIGGMLIGTGSANAGSTMGSIEIICGERGGNDSGSAGSIYINAGIRSGTTASGSAGNVDISAGDSLGASTTAVPGRIFLHAGNSDNGPGGYVQIKAEYLNRGPNLSDFVRESYHANINVQGSFSAVVDELTYVAADYNAAVITYHLQDTTTNDVRVGTIYVSNNTTITTIADTFTETDPMDITWSAAINAGNVEITATVGSVTNKLAHFDVKRYQAVTI